MDWKQITIYTTAAGIEPLCGRLYGVGITGVEIEDRDDFETFLEENKQYWDYVDDDLRSEKQGETCVKVYISDNASGMEQLCAIQSELDALKRMDTEGAFGRLEIATETLREEDWANNWKQYFKPIYVGDRLVILPEWESIPDGEGKIVFRIDPGMTFGSGQHETTRLCVETLDTLVRPGCRVLDLGCGSGILSIIALLLGAAKADALDIDPNCQKIAYQNAELNGIGRDVYTVRAGNVLTDDALKQSLAESGGYDVVVANIVADVIIPLCADVARYMKTGASFLCSGIIEGRCEEVQKALMDNGFVIDSVRRDKDWYAILSHRAD